MTNILKSLMSEPWQKLYKKEVEGKSENLKEAIPEITISHSWYLRMRIKNSELFKNYCFASGL